MNPDIVIREADSEDVNKLAAVGMTSFRAAYENWSEPDDLIEHLDTFFSARAIQTEIQRPRVHYLIAMCNGNPAGFVKIRTGSTPDDVPGDSPLELHQVYVIPDQQRFGVGRRLIEAAADFARNQANDGIWLSVWEDAPWAVNFYRKCGFSEVGVMDFKLGKSV